MLQALLVVARAIALGADRWRSRVAARRPMLVEISVLREHLATALEQNALLRARLDRVPHRRRPQYRPHEHLAILYHAVRFGLSVEKTARAFVVSVSAHDVASRRAVRGASPGLYEAPCEQAPRPVADLARRLRGEWPGWGTRRIAGVLARLGIAVSRTSVRAFLRRKPKRPSPAAARLVRGRLVAKHPGHVAARPALRQVVGAGTGTPRRAFVPCSSPKVPMATATCPSCACGASPEPIAR